MYETYSDRSSETSESLDIKTLQTLEAEQSVVGALLINGALIKTVQATPDDFMDVRLRMIFTAMRSVESKGNPVDLTMLVDEMGTVVQEIGLDYMLQVADSVPTTKNIDYYDGLVRRYAKERKAKNIMATFLNGDADFDETLTLLSKLDAKGTTKTSKSLSEIMSDLYIDVMSDKHGVSGYSFGFPGIDRILDGIQPGENLIIGARPAMGKTAFVLNLSNNMAKQGIGVSLINYEMFALAIGRRMMAAEANIETHTLKNGTRMKDNDWMRFMRSAGDLANLPIKVHEASGMSVRDIRRAVIQDMHEMQCERHVIIIDYLQLIKYHGNASTPKHLQIGQISWELKQIALELGVPVIILSQLSRSVEQRQDKRPQMSDIRDSGEVEQNADIIAFLYRDEYYDKESEDAGVVEFIISKQREGATGTVKLAFRKEYGKIISLEQELGA